MPVLAEGEEKIDMIMSGVFPAKREPAGGFVMSGALPVVGK